jgi:hypothetical protein
LFKYFFDKNSKKEFFTYYNQKESCICFINVNDTIVVNKFFLKGIDKINDYVVFNSDSIIVLSEPSDLFTLTHENKYSFELTDSIPEYKHNFYLSSFFGYPISSYGNELLIYNFPGEVLNNKTKLKKYFATSRDLHLQLIHNEIKITELTGRYPDYYKENNFYVYCPTRTIGADGNLIYSFDDSPNIFLYDSVLKNYEEKTLTTPDFKENVSFDESKIYDHNYITKYYIENDRFLNLIYNPNKHVYYRIFSKGISYENDDGTINRDKPFTVLIYDSSFNLKNQISFPAKKYKNLIIYITKENELLITNDEYEKGNTSLHAFDFN